MCYNAHMNFQGILTAVLSLVTIGAFHPIVIKAEYHFTKSIWPAFLVAGLALCAGSLFVRGLPSVALALVGAACLWSVGELFEQERRVERGWFPSGPRHTPVHTSEKGGKHSKEEQSPSSSV